MIKLLFFTLFSIYAFSGEITSVNFLQQGEVSQLVIHYNGDASYEKSSLANKKQIIFDVKGVVANKKTLRAINTSEFSGSMVYVSGFKKEGSLSDVRFVVQLRDNVQSRVKTGNGKIVLEVENRFGAFASSGETIIPTGLESSVSSELNPMVVGQVGSSDQAEISDILKNLTMSGDKKFFGRKISINVKNLPLSDLLKMIAQVSGFNIITSSGVEGKPKMSLSLKNVAWDEALDIILKLNKLVAIKRLNILQVITQEKFIADEKARIDAIKAKKTLDPLETRIFSINFSTLNEVKGAVTSHITKNRGTLTMSERTSKLIVKDTKKQLDKISEIIKEIDVETPQVLIEAKIVEISDSSLLQYGLSGGLGGALSIGGVGGANLGKTTGLELSEGGQAGSESPEGTARFLYNTTGQGLLNFNIIKNFGRISGILDIMETENKSKVITSPRIITKDNQDATIASTRQTSYSSAVTSNGVVTSTFETASATLNLTVTPKVSNDGTINLKISVSNGEFGEPKAAGQGPPDTTNNTVNTNVLVENGSTVIIGGLYKTREGKSMTGVPILKDLPIIGWFFRTSKVQRPSKSELMIFITPRVINDQGKGTELSQVVE